MKRLTSLGTPRASSCFRFADVSTRPWARHSPSEHTLPGSTMNPARDTCELTVIVGSLDAAGTHLPECLASLQSACEGIDAEILVVDGSADASLDAVSRASSPPRAFIAMPRRNARARLWGRGLRRGARAGRRLHHRPVPRRGRVGPHPDRRHSDGRGRRWRPARRPSRHVAPPVAPPSICGTRPGCASPDGPAHEIAGDNAAYDHAALRAVRNDAGGARSGKSKRTRASASSAERSSCIRARRPGSPTTRRSRRWPPGASRTGGTRARFACGAGFARDGRWSSARRSFPSFSSRAWPGGSLRARVTCRGS